MEKSKTLLFIVIAALVSSNLYLYKKVNSLENKIYDNGNQIRVTSDNLTRKVNDIYADVEEMLKKQQSIFDSVNIKTGGLNNQSFTVPLHIEVIPKSISEGATAELILKNMAFPMTREGISFKIDVPISIFEYFDPSEVKVVITDGGKKTVETLERMEFTNIRERYLLQAYPHFSGQSSYSRSYVGKELGGIYSRNGRIEIDIKSGDNYPEEIKYVREINGINVMEKSIPTGNSDKDLSGHISFDMDKSDLITLRPNDKLIEYIFITDRYGLVYKYIVAYYEIDANGDPVKGRPDYVFRNLIEICDKKGNVLWKNYTEN